MGALAFRLGRAQARSRIRRIRQVSDQGRHMRKQVIILAALILAPLGARAGDLVVWWGK